jgi:predicted amidohydrolase YtcJ
MSPDLRRSTLALGAAVLLSVSCQSPPLTDDLLLVNGRVYTLNWDDPALDGTPARNAPHDDSGWHPDAEAVLIQDGIVVFVGSDAEARQLAAPDVRVVDVGGATVLPGLIDSHTHVENMGSDLSQVSLVGIETEEDAVAKVAEFARGVPAGQWVLGHGWDEGAWANQYPTMELLSRAVPDQPVLLAGLHSFAVWGNEMAFALAGITAATPDPEGGEILRDEQGQPTGILINRATVLLTGEIPLPTGEQREVHVLAGLELMAQSGFVAVHEAGVDRESLAAFAALEDDGLLPLRVYAMLSARDKDLAQEWLLSGPRTDGQLVVRSVKAFFDGALGSRGAHLFDDYWDMPGHRGVSGGEYGFDQDLAAELMRAGFQIAVHAIGDAGNRGTLDFIQDTILSQENVREGRHRIEHAQILHPDDFERFAKLGVIASMEPAHAMEDKAWAEDRLGPGRIRGAYAWRSLRQAGTALTFNSDLPGSDHNIFYGLHSAITRQDKDLQPADGWFPEQRMTPEEALRGYTTWAAYSEFAEDRTGILAPGFRGDVTVMDIDLFVTGETEPNRILAGSILMTIVAGKTVYDRSDGNPENN